MKYRTSWIVTIIFVIALSVVAEKMGVNPFAGEKSVGAAVVEALKKQAQPQMSAEVKGAIYKLQKLQPGDLIFLPNLDLEIKTSAGILAVVANDGKEIGGTTGSDSLWRYNIGALAQQMATNRAAVSIYYQHGDGAYSVQTKQFVFQAVERMRRSRGIK